MTHAIDYCYHDFRHEIVELFKENDFNFGSVASDPVKLVRLALLKSVCGYHNGGTIHSIIVHLGYITPRHNSRDKLTAKGKAFLWKEFGEGC